MVFETFLKAHFVKTFQHLCRILNDVISITKAPSLQCGFRSKERVQISWMLVRKLWRKLRCCHIDLC